MSREKSTLPQLRYHSSSNRWYAWYGGRRHYLGHDKAEAETAYAKFLGRLAEARERPAESSVPPLSFAHNPAITVAEALLEYERRVLARVEDKRQTFRQRAAIDAVLAVCGSLPAAQFKSLALLRVRDHLLTLKVRRTKKARGPKKGPRGKILAPAPPPPPPAAPLSRAYVNELIGALKCVWQWLVSREVVPAETLEYMRSVKSLTEGEGGRETDRVTPPEPGAVEATLPHLSRIVRAMVLVQALTGARPGEVCRMRRCDISTDPAERLPLPKTKLNVAAFRPEMDDGKPGPLVWLYVPPTHKTARKGKPRAVLIGPKAQEVLRPFFDGRPADAFLFSPREATDEFRTRHKRSCRCGREPGPNYTTQSYGRHVVMTVARLNKRRAEAGEGLIAAWAPNQLRHQNATDTSEEFDRETAAARLGHADLDVINIYAEQSIKKAAKAAALMG
jgi:integrase